MTFNDIQPTVWDRFKRAKKNNRIGTAYLFTGPRGCGKEWGAIQFAKYLNCENAGEISCEKCSSCSKFFGLQHPNLKLIVPLPCLLYTSPSPRDRTRSRMPSSA